MYVGISPEEGRVSICVKDSTNIHNFICPRVTQETLTKCQSMFEEILSILALNLRDQQINQTVICLSPKCNVDFKNELTRIGNAYGFYNIHFISVAVAVYIGAVIQNDTFLENLQEKDLFVVAQNHGSNIICYLWKKFASKVVLRNEFIQNLDNVVAFPFHVQAPNLEDYERLIDDRNKIKLTLVDDAIANNIVNRLFHETSWQTFVFKTPKRGTRSEQRLFFYSNAALIKAKINGGEEDVIKFDATASIPQIGIIFRENEINAIDLETNQILPGFPFPFAVTYTDKNTHVGDSTKIDGTKIYGNDAMQLLANKGLNSDFFLFGKNIILSPTGDEAYFTANIEGLNKCIKPESVMEEICKEIKNRLNQNNGNEKSIIFAHPRYFNETQKLTFERIAKIAGLSDITLVDELSMLQIGFREHYKIASNKIFLILDLNGVELNILLCQANEIKITELDFKKLNLFNILGGSMTNLSLCNFVIENLKEMLKSKHTSFHDLDFIGTTDPLFIESLKKQNNECQIEFINDSKNLIEMGLSNYHLYY